MLVRRQVLDAIARGEVTLAFRRWKRPTVQAGGRLRTAIGELAIDAVEPVEEAAIDEADARRAGFADRAELLDELARRRGGRLYRIELRWAGEDPRVRLRRQAELATAEVAELERRLDRFDGASRRGPWTEKTLGLIAGHPATRAADLARMAGWETAWLKRNVRKLKELGLTTSLSPGYRLSPRGRAFLALRGAAADPAP